MTQLKEYYKNGQFFWYMTATEKTGPKYLPGFVNEVMCYPPAESGGYEVRYTDGYKTQLLGFYETRELAIEFMEKALREGAGGGLTSRFKPNPHHKPDGCDGYALYVRVSETVNGPWETLKANKWHCCPDIFPLPSEETVKSWVDKHSNGTATCEFKTVYQREQDA